MCNSRPGYSFRPLWASSVTKTIDALELKRRLQESLQKRLEALSDEQRLDRLRESGAGAPDRDDARDSR
jgi:hypothetical protein